MTTVIEARGLTKSYGRKRALDGVSFSIDSGRIVGIIGPNGAGKTTALKAILGLTPFEGELTVLGRSPRTERDVLMRDVCFIADVAVLPKWLRVSQALEFVAGVQKRADVTEQQINHLLDRLTKPGRVEPALHQILGVAIAMTATVMMGVLIR